MEVKIWIDHHWGWVSVRVGTLYIMYKRMWITKTLSILWEILGKILILKTCLMPNN